ncbi:SLC10A3_5 [Mytilus coruscus]|uniref:SLC10A3_5 n=1 Tax=Mytilus coruscus TaxID=42192 RepID=A0A6J8CL63_MYTCO|nr:SLC10A3_5 [Mytilus coruscus]
MEALLFISIVICAMFQCTSSSWINTTITDQVQAKRKYSLKISHPGIIVLYTNVRSQSMSMNYTLLCEEQCTITMKVAANDKTLVDLRLKDEIIQCGNKSSEIEKRNNSVSDEFSYYHDGSISLRMSGKRLGRTFISFNLYNLSSTDEILVGKQKFPLIVLRKEEPASEIFKSMMYIVMVIVNFGFGCKTNLQAVKETYRRPIAPVIGISCQLLLMPMIGYGIAKLVTPGEPYISLGIFIVSCCPGGGLSNIFSYLLGGDISLSVSLTVVSIMLSFGTMPLWLFTLGREFSTRAETEMPYLEVVTTLLILLIPLLIGVFIQYKLTRVHKFILKILLPITIVSVILLVVIGLYSNWYIFEMFNAKIFLPASILPLSGNIISGLISWIARLPWTCVKTIAIETGLQNTGIAILVIMFAFPQPEGLIAVVVPLATGIITQLPLIAVSIPYLIYTRCNGKRDEPESANEEVDKNSSK